MRTLTAACCLQPQSQDPARPIRRPCKAKNTSVSVTASCSKEAVEPNQILKWNTVESLPPVAPRLPKHHATHQTCTVYSIPETKTLSSPLSRAVSGQVSKRTVSFGATVEGGLWQNSIAASEQSRLYPLPNPNHIRQPFKHWHGSERAIC